MIIVGAARLNNGSPLHPRPEIRPSPSALPTLVRTPVAIALPLARENSGTESLVEDRIFVLWVCDFRALICGRNSDLRAIGLQIKFSCGFDGFWCLLFACKQVMVSELGRRWSVRNLKVWRVGGGGEQRSWSYFLASGVMLRKMVASNWGWLCGEVCSEGKEGVFFFRVWSFGRKPRAWQGCCLLWTGAAHRLATAAILFYLSIFEESSRYLCVLFLQ